MTTRRAAESELYLTSRNPATKTESGEWRCGDCGGALVLTEMFGMTMADCEACRRCTGLPLGKP